MNDYTFVDEKRGWMVGEKGTILTTSDAGLSWQQQVSNTETPFSIAYFVNAQIGWVLANNGAALKTSNGGVTWSSTYLPFQGGVTAFGASDENNAWFADGNSTGGVFATKDGGTTWTRIVVSGEGTYLYFPVSTSDVWALPTSGLEAGLRHTTDAGVTWTTTALPTLESGLYRSIDKLLATDSNNVWITGTDSGWLNEAYISRKLGIKTSDGGKTWQSFTVPASGMRDLKFVDANNGFALSAQNDSLLRSRDGGLTWQSLPLPKIDNTYVQSLKALSPNLLVIKDGAGRFHRSSDAGTSWQDGSSGANDLAALTNIWFFNSREGIALDFDDVIKRTNDGGQTWVKQHLSVSPAGGYRWQFLDNGTGWMITSSATIYRSTDMGKTWVAPDEKIGTTLHNPKDFYFIDENSGWAITGYSYLQEGSIFRSVDGGVSWQAVPNTAITGLTAIGFGDALHGVAVTERGIAYVTTDGGKTWLPRTLNYEYNLRRLAFADAKTVVAVGDYGAIIRSIDGGMTWSTIARMTFSHLKQVHFISAKQGWVVGDDGVVMATQDGGVTWAMQPSGSGRNFLDVFFINQQTGWLVGSNGTIMGTTTGGR
jgi:photosystem II stability/assembly factor-like uncharacterized protein